MKVADDPTDGLPVDVDEALHQAKLRADQPADLVSSADEELHRGDWLDAAQVLKLMQGRGSTKEGVEISILNQVAFEKDGRAAIRSRAKLLVFMPASFSSKPVSRLTDSIIRVWMWWGTLLSSDWGGGTFVIETEAPYGTWTMHGVEFFADDLRALGLVGEHVPLPELPGPVADPNRPSNRGRKRKPEWDTFVAELALAASDGDITPQMTETQLLNVVNDRLGKLSIDEMPRTTVQSVLTAVLRRFRDDEVEEN